MASSASYEAVRSLLASAFAGVPVLRWEDIDESVEQSDLPWLAIEDSIASETAESIGSPQAHCLREEGELLVHVFTPSVKNLEAARSIGDQIRTAVRYRYVHTPVGWLNTRNAGPPAQELV